MKIFKYIISNGDYTRLYVDKEMAKYIEELCSIHGSGNYYRYFSKYYNARECCYEFTCDRELTKKVMEVHTSCCETNTNKSKMTLNRELAEYLNDAISTNNLYNTYTTILDKEEYNTPVKCNYNARRIPTPVKIINHGPATIVFWNDKTKTVVKCSAHDEFDIDMAITMACLKKMVGDEAYAAAKQMGHKKRLNDIIEWKY